MSKIEIGITGKDMMNKLIPILNLDPQKCYTSIIVEADLDDMARITTETIASEPSDDNL